MLKPQDLPKICANYRGPDKAANKGNGVADGNRTISEGQRNNALTSEAGKLRRLGLDAPEIEAALQSMNARRCDPPLPEDEVSTIAASIGQYRAGDRPKRTLNGFEAITAAELLRKEMPEVDWTISETIPEGVSILAGKPKIGKSWMVYDMCLAVVSGGRALGRFHTAKGSALYLALEDNERRLQRRLTALLAGRGQGNLPGLDRYICVTTGPNPMKGV
jgi:hypothetical protein